MAFDNRGFLFALLLVAALVVGTASAATYVVGDSLGWRVPDSPSDYANWASQHAFRVGDVLVFNFTSGFHDVAQVSKASFDDCSSNSPIFLTTLGPSNTTLSAAGPAYYICTFGSHCSLGQKLAINVSAASTPAPPPSTPTPSPSPPTPTTPTPMPTPTTPTPTPMPTPTTPTPTPTPTTPTPTPAPTPMPVPSPGSSPAPAPGGSASPPPGMEGRPPTSPTSPGAVSPPPPPPRNSATISTASASLVGLAFITVCLMI